MIHILAAPTEFVLSSSHYARTYRLLKQLEANDTKITVYTNRLNTGSSRFPDNISIHPFNKPNRLSYFTSLHRELYATIRSDDVDVYQHANLGFREFNPGVILPPDSDTPFLIGPAEAGHAVPSAEFKRVLARQVDRDLPEVVESVAARLTEPVMRSGIDPLRERLFGATLDRADRIIAVHSDAKRRFEEYTDGGKIEVVPYGVDMEKFPFAGGREGRSIVTVGNLIRRKGHRYLLAAVETVASEFPDVTLHVVGTGPLREELESQTESLGIGDSVMFHGFVDDERLVELLQRAQAFVHPSLSEGFSHARLEAMATGCPVVGTDVSGAHDLTRDGTDGYIVPTGDSDALADAMLELLSDAERVDEMGRNARDKIERDHDYADIGKRYLEIYREMVA